MLGVADPPSFFTFHHCILTVPLHCHMLYSILPNSWGGRFLTCPPRSFSLHIPLSRFSSSPLSPLTRFLPDPNSHKAVSSAHSFLLSSLFLFFTFCFKGVVQLSCFGQSSILASPCRLQQLATFECTYHLVINEVKRPRKPQGDSEC